MESVAAKLKNKHGEIALKLGILLVVLTLVIFLAMQVWRIYFAFDSAKEKTNQAVLAVAAYNVAEFYGGAREGDGQARHPLGGGNFDSVVSTEDVIAQLAVMLNAEVIDNTTLHKEGNYRIEHLNVQYLNSVNGNLNFKTTFTLAIQFSFSGEQLDGIVSEVEVRTTYEPKF